VVPAARDFGSIARTLLSNARSDGRRLILARPSDRPPNQSPFYDGRLIVRNKATSPWQLDEHQQRRGEDDQAGRKRRMLLASAVGRDGLESKADTGAYGSSDAVFSAARKRTNRKIRSKS